MRWRVVIPALAVAAALPAIAIPRIMGPAHDDDARRMSVSTLSFAIYADVRAHERAVQVTARRLAAFQALPPELMQRTLAELGAGYPAFQALYVVDTEGTVLADWQRDPKATHPMTDPPPTAERSMPATPI
jgi:hypothetical protein